MITDEISQLPTLLQGKGEEKKEREANGGTLEIYNEYGKSVATVQSNKEADGAIVLYDRYGDLIRSKTGKK